jgi:hypothetical protein
MRFRITVRGDGIELRGYIDGPEGNEYKPVSDLSDALDPFGMVIASVAADNYDPFRISEPEYPPTIEASREVIRSIMGSDVDAGTIMNILATLHLSQAEVIRQERALREKAEAELRDRELHHFETEQLLDRLRQARSNHPDLPVCEKHPDPQDFVKCGWRSAIEDIDKVLAEVPE